VDHHASARAAHCRSATHHIHRIDVGTKKNSSGMTNGSASSLAKHLALTTECCPSWSASHRRDTLYASSPPRALVAATAPPCTAATLARCCRCCRRRHNHIALPKQRKQSQVTSKPSDSNRRRPKLQQSQRPDRRKAMRRWGSTEHESLQRKLLHGGNQREAQLQTASEPPRVKARKAVSQMAEREER